MRKDESDSGTGSESEKEDILEHMTKEQLWAAMTKSRCIMLAGRNPRHMTKDEMVKYLLDCECPVLLKLLKFKSLKKK
jgi:hypothetical protein